MGYGRASRRSYQPIIRKGACMVTPNRGGTMSEHFLDDITKALGHGTVSRGQTVKLAGAALVSALFGGVFAPPAGARSLSRGRRGKREDDDGGSHTHQHPESSRSRCCPPGSFKTTAPTPHGECT